MNKATKKLLFLTGKNIYDKMKKIFFIKKIMKKLYGSRLSFLGSLFLLVFLGILIQIFYPFEILIYYFFLYFLVYFRFKHILAEKGKYFLEIFFVLGFILSLFEDYQAVSLLVLFLFIISGIIFEKKEKDILPIKSTENKENIGISPKNEKILEPKRKKRFYESGPWFFGLSFIIFLFLLLSLFLKFFIYFGIFLFHSFFFIITFGFYKFDIDIREYENLSQILDFLFLYIPLYNNFFLVLLNILMFFRLKYIFYDKIYIPIIIFVINISLIFNFLNFEINYTFVAIPISMAICFYERKPEKIEEKKTLEF